MTSMYSHRENGWRLCSATVRCGLCSSALLKGDHVIIVRKDGHHSTPFMFTFDQAYRDEEDKVRYNLYIVEEWDPDNFAMTCHVQCIAMEHAHLNRGLFKATWYSYHPSPQELARRNRWLWRKLAQVLHGALGRFSVPLEVCEEIAQHCCMRGILIATANAFWLETEKEPEGRHPFSLGADVWARYVEFQGVQYIASLKNTPRDQQMSKIYSATPARKIKYIYVAEDYLGVRDVRFVDSSNEETPHMERSPGLWWKTIEVTDTTELEACNDGTKLRTIYTSDNVVGYSSMFEVPLPLNNQLRWEPIFHPFISRLTSLILNGPKTTAYSVCCDARPYTILAHTPGKQDSYSYDVGPIAAREAVWLYMPMDEDERITELWVRSWRENYIEDAALVFRTSKGRTNVMGTYPGKNWGRYSYKCIYRTTASPNRIYFAKSMRGIREFAFENLTPLLSAYGAQPELPQPESLLVRSYYSFRYFYTFASLDDVAEVTPCVLEVEDFGPAIVGLLFRYRDGRRASVGQIRLNMLQPSLEVSMASRGLCLRFDWSAQGCINVTWVDVQTWELEEEQIDADAQLNIPWSGKLE